MKLTKPIGFITTVTPTFAWTMAETAITYDLTVVNGVSGDDVISKVCNSLSHTLITPLELGTYIWKVEAKNEAGESIAEEQSRFTLTDTVTEITITGRKEADAFREYENLRHDLTAKIRRYQMMTREILTSNRTLEQMLTGKAKLAGYHQDMVKMTPGVDNLLNQLKQSVQATDDIITELLKRDPDF